MPRTVRENVIHPITVRELEVSRIADVTSGMLRVTLTGEQLGAFHADGISHPAFRTLGFDDDLRLYFCYPDDDEPVLPIQKDGTIETPKGKRPLHRYFTVRRFAPETGELDIDFVKHGTGVATTWALRCGVGDRLHVAGPAHSALMPKDVDWMLVAGDETALPSIGRLLEEAPPGLRVQAFVEVGEPGHRQDFETGADVAVTWLYRDGVDPGTTTLLADAVVSAEWWPGQVYAWVSGEAMSIKPIRRYLKDEREVPSEYVEVTGYWRHGAVVTRPEDPAVPDSEQIEEPFDVLHELGELLPPLALRAAVTLGIPELIVRGTTDVDGLARTTGADPVGLGKLLRYLTVIDVVARAPSGGYRLTHVGELLTQEFVIDVLDVEAPIGRQEMACLGLLDAVRTGTPSYPVVYGRSLADDRADPAFEASLQEQISKYARYLAPALAEDEAVERARTLVVHSDGAGVIAEAIAVASPGARIGIAGLPSTLAYFRSDLEASITDPQVRERIDLVECSVFETPPPSDAVVLIRALDAHRDADAVHILRRAAAGVLPGGALLVVDHPLDEASADEHAFEEDLKQFVLHGTGHRSDAEHRALFEQAGLRLADTRVVGWGFTLYELGTR